MGAFECILLESNVTSSESPQIFRLNKFRSTVLKHNHTFRLHWNSSYLVLWIPPRSILSWDVETITEGVNRTDR